MMSSVNFASIHAEIFLLVALCLIMIFDLLQRDRERKSTFALVILCLVGLFIFDINQLQIEKQVSFSGHWVIDRLAVILKLAIYVATFIALLYARPFIIHRKIMRGEYYLLTLFSLLGMMIMVSANSFLTAYLGLELLSLSLYAMVALQRDAKLAAEAAVKYFVMGGLASGFLLYGISLIYGATGSVIISDVAGYFANNSASLTSQFALVFIVIGLAFKFGAVPFHMWLPDIYQGSPSSVTAYIASVPKIAAFGMTMRILVEAFPQLDQHWTQMIIILALLSIAFGNIIAISQNNLKRLLAYSAIAHIGYFLLGLVPATDASYAAAMYYIIVYSLMTLAGFGMVIFMTSNDREYELISHLRGLGRYHPWYALIFTLVMISLAGIPPLIGFWPKLEIFRHLINHGYVPQAVIAIAFSVVGLFYYLKVVKEMFFAESSENPVVSNSRSLKVAISINCILLVIFGLMPDSIYQYCLSAFNLTK